MPRNVSIAACQFVVRPVGSFDEFAAHARGLLDQAEGADLVLFPELFTVELFTTFPDWKDLPVSELTRVHQYGNTNYTEDYRQLFESEAKERGQHIVAGSHLEKKDGRYLNVAYLYGPDGLIHMHDKTHIFPAEAQWSTEEGDTVKMVELPFAKVGFNVCYETEIPECAATLVEQGAEIILCPSFTFTGIRILARSSLRSGARDRKPGVLRALRDRRGRAGRWTAPAGLDEQLDSEPLRHPVDRPERRRRGIAGTQH